MLKDFDAIKAQLAELAEVINKFKSEAVQLRIVELVFQGSAPPPEPEEEVPEKPARQTRRRPTRKSASTENGESTSSPKKKASNGSGAIATLSKVYGEGFFKTPRTINDILKHCETNLARRIKANEISGKLARMVRTGELKRVKNSDSQYEYTKP